MSQRTLFVNIKKEQISKVEALLKILKYTVSKINLKDVSFNEFEDKTVLSFSFNDDYYSTVLERFALNKIEVMVNDDESQKIIDNAERKLKRKDSVVGVGWGDSGKTKTKKTVAKLVEEGNYEELIKISRDVREDKGKSERAKVAIDAALKNVITNSYTAGKKDSFKTEQYFEKLLKVAANSYLRMNNKNEFRKEAGLLAINLAASEPELYSLLIKMGNKSSLLPELSIKAILKFYNLVLVKKSMNSKIVQFAAKQINEKYLKSLFDDYKSKLSKDEKFAFAKFVNFMRDARKKGNTST